MKLEGFLKKIYTLVEEEIENARRVSSLEKMKQQAYARTLPLIDVVQVIREREEKVSVIAEIKRASPSVGTLSERDIQEQAQSYVEGEAAAISVLTEPTYFKGSLGDLTQLKEIFPDTPFLRKDFIIDEYQVYQSKAAGADALLLITQLLDDDLLTKLYELVRSLGMHALVEVENEEGMERAVALNVELIGINARNMSDLSVDTGRVVRFAKKYGDTDSILVGESGITSSDVVRNYVHSGIEAVLVGGYLMKATDPTAVIQSLME